MIEKCQRCVLKIFDRFCSYSWMIKKLKKVTWEACFFYIFEYIVAVYFLLKIVMLYFDNSENQSELSRKSGKEIVEVWSGYQIFPSLQEGWGSRLEVKTIYADLNDDIDEEIRRCFVDVIRYVYGEDTQLYGITALTKQPENDVFYLRSRGERKFFKIWKYTFVSMDYDHGQGYCFLDWNWDEYYAVDEVKALIELFDPDVPIPVHSGRAIQVLQDNIEVWRAFHQKSDVITYSYSSNQACEHLDWVVNLLKWQEIIDEGQIKCQPWISQKMIELRQKCLQFYQQWYPVDTHFMEFQLLHNDLQDFDFSTHKSFKPSFYADAHEKFSKYRNYLFWMSVESNLIDGAKLNMNVLQQDMIDNFLWTRGVDDRLILNTDQTLFIRFFEVLENWYWDLFENWDDFIAYLKKCHWSLLRRVNDQGGLFRTSVVEGKPHPFYIEGILRMAHYMSRDLTVMQKALFFHAVIESIQPFEKASWVLSRIVMNCLLVEAWEYPIFITHQQKIFYGIALESYYCPILESDLDTYLSRMDLLHTLSCEKGFDYPNFRGEWDQRLPNDEKWVESDCEECADFFSSSFLTEKVKNQI